MGATLSSPVELIRVQRHGNEFYRAAVADMQGWRNGHEDGHAINCASATGSFWVLDGHGGDGCARFCSPRLGEDFAKAQFPDDERLVEGLEAVDRSFYEHVQENPDQDSGSTVVGCVTQRLDDGTYRVKLANAGDSRGLIVRGPDATEAAPPLEVRLPPHLAALGSVGVAAPRGAGAPGYKEPNKCGNPRFACRWPVVAESVDHKPSHPTEQARIEAAGGSVSQDEPPRLDGNLAVSRGLGDFEYKCDSGLPPAEQKVSCVPDIYEVQGVPAGSIVVLACDGLWDVFTGEFIATTVRDELAKNPKHDLGEIAAHLIKRSLAEKNTRDNVTLMIVQLVDGTEWAAVPDEMKGWEKLVPGDDNRLEEDAKRQYITFLNRAGFDEKPRPCTICSKWIREMNQCPCKTAYFCCRHCQKKGWKAHKPVCPFVKDSLAGKS